MGFRRSVTSLQETKMVPVLTSLSFYLDSCIFYYGTSRKVLAMVDVRTEGNASVIRNDAMINTLYASRDGVHVITGDAQGFVKVWDVRSSKSL